MSRREEASKLNSENIGPVKRIRPLPQALHVSSLCAFGAAGRAFNGCREGQFDECGVVVGGHHFAKSSVDGRRCDSDGIVGDSELRQDAPSEGWKCLLAHCVLCYLSRTGLTEVWADW